MGIIFGLNEDLIRDRIRNSGTEALETVYRGDEAAMNKVSKRSWNYMKRAHLHAGGMGTTAVALILLVGLLGVARPVAKATSIALGGGGLGYSAFWMWAGFRAPGLGGTGPAKESLRWLAMPSSGAFVLATVGVLCLVIATLFKNQETEVESFQSSS